MTSQNGPQKEDGLEVWPGVPSFSRRVGPPRPPLGPNGIPHSGHGPTEAASASAPEPSAEPVAGPARATDDHAAEPAGAESVDAPGPDVPPSPPAAQPPSPARRMWVRGAALFASGVLVGTAAVGAAMIWLPEHLPHRPPSWPGGMAAEAAPSPIPDPSGESVAMPSVAARPGAPVPDPDTEPFPTADRPDGVGDLTSTIPPAAAPSAAAPTAKPEPPKSRQVAGQTRPPDPPQARRHARLIIHHGGGPGDEEAAQRIARYLQSYGFPRAMLRASRNRTDVPGVRYYHAQDAAAAQRLAQVMDWYVAEARRFRPRPAKPVGDEMAPGLLELWLPD